MDLARYIRDIPDFPKKGILFKDITPLLQDAAALKAAADGLTEPWKGRGIQKVVGLESRGFPTMWIPNVFGLEAITAAAAVGRETEHIELGTAVVPTYPRHPTSLAEQALTASSACRGRFTLGIGLSPPPVIEHMMGLSYARRAAHMREYMAVLGPLLRGEPAASGGRSTG